MRTMRRLGKHGRFANQLFQYAYLRLTSGDNYQCAPWIGQYLFGHNDPPVAFKFWQAKEKRVYDAKDSTLSKLNNVDLVGYFQYHTSFYRPFQSEFKALFQPTEEVRRRVHPQVERLREAGRTLVGLHLRRGDYGTFRRKSARWCFVAPTEWYRNWLARNWERLEKPVLFIASDEPEKVVHDFHEYHPHVSDVALPRAPFYPDFYTLTQCDVLLISNSSFGFAASMLSDDETECYRPRLGLSRMIPYDPWNAYTVYRDERY